MIKKHCHRYKTTSVVFSVSNRSSSDELIHARIATLALLYLFLYIYYIKLKPLLSINVVESHMTQQNDGNFFFVLCSLNSFFVSLNYILHITAEQLLLLFLLLLLLMIFVFEQKRCKIVEGNPLNLLSLII